MIPARLAGYYGGVFFVIGIMLPFWPLWLQARGLNPEDIGIVMGVGMLMKVVANPFIAGYADHTGRRRSPLIIFSFFAAAAFTAFWWAHGFWPILIVTMVFFLFWSPLMPLTETLTTYFDTMGMLDYGRVRLWGSLTFIAAAWGGGWVLTGRGENLIYWVILSGTLVVVIWALLLPDAKIPPNYHKHSYSPFTQVLKNHVFLRFILATGLIQTSHIVYYTFGTIQWQKVGYSEVMIGWLWAEGVIAEVIVFIWGHRIVRKFGPTRLIAFAGLAGLIRWFGTGVTDAFPALLVLQILHGATFGAAHLGAIHFITEHMDISITATAQSIYAAAVSGIGFSLASLLSGYLYVKHGSNAYYFMALTAGLGGLIAFQIRRRHSLR